MADARRQIAVVGGGITGLAAAHRLLTAAPDDDGLRVIVLEASDRFGGWVRTEEFAGRRVDFGPDSLLTRAPWAAELASELGIADDLVAPAAGTSLLLSRGRLRALPRGIMAGLPDGPMPFVRSGLLGPLGVARAGLDLVLPANAPSADESIGALIRRRFGSQVLERVIDPLLGGVHAGRCDDLSLRATAPQFAAAATADRSLLKGLRATAPPAPPAGSPPPTVFQAPRTGMGQIVARLIEELEADPRATLRTGAPVDALDSLDADAIVLATPAYIAAELIASAAPAAARILAELPYATITHITLAYDPGQLPQLPEDATGFLVTRPEGLLMTACTFVNRKWDREASSDAFIIRCSAGRIDDERASKMDDEALIAAITAELRTVLGITQAPIETRVTRYPQAMPQYRPGHLDRIEAATAQLAEALPQVRLAGAAYRGSSVPNCIRDGREAADDLLQQTNH